ncbi:hypothetical protein [Streptomyces sp. NPDC051000]
MVPLFSASEAASWKRASLCPDHPEYLKAVHTTLVAVLERTP